MAAEQFWSSTPRECETIAAGLDERLRHEHNGRMLAAWWSGVIAKSAQTVALSKLMIEGGSAPASKRKMKWQEVKAALQLALPDKTSK